MRFTITTLAVGRCTVMDGNTTCQELNLSGMLRLSMYDDAVSVNTSAHGRHKARFSVCWGYYATCTMRHPLPTTEMIIVPLPTPSPTPFPTTTAANKTMTAAFSRCYATSL